jgi:hypothetical protein
MTDRSGNNNFPPVRRVLFFYFSHGVRLTVSPLGIAATVWPIVPAPDDDDDDDDCGPSGGIQTGRVNRITGRNPAPVPLCPLHIPHNQTRARTQAAPVGSRRLTA